MATYLGQDVKKTFWLPEAAYGATPAVGVEAELYYLGEVYDFVPDINLNPEESLFEDRAFTDVDYGPYEYGFQMQAKVRQGDGTWDPADFWALYSLGAADGRAADGLLDSFSLITRKSTNKYVLWNGCVMDAMSITSPGVGKSLLFQAICRSRFADRAATTAFTGLQDVTIGADPTPPTTKFIKWLGTALTIDYGAGAANLSGVETWKLDIKNNIAHELFEATPDSGTDDFPVVEQFDEQGFDCTVDITRFHRDESVFDEARDMTEDITLTIPIDDAVWTLSGGYFPKVTAPGHKTGKERLMESFQLKFNAVAIA